MNQTLSRFARNESGATTVLFAVSVVSVLLTAGVAIDFARSDNTRSHLQSAADSAALAGASLSGATVEERIEAANVTFTANVGLSPPPVPSVIVENGVVTVSAKGTIPATLMALGGHNQLQIGVVAQAAAQTQPLACIIALEDTEFGIEANSDSSLTASCGIQVNSQHNEAIFANSNGHITGTSVLVSGIAMINSGGSVTPPAVENSPAVADPLVSLPEPSVGSCDHTDFTANSGASVVMRPGVYCQKTIINSGATAVMEPGVYIFTGGEYEINSLSSVTGSGVMMYFADQSARLNVNSGSILELSAPTSGTYAGMLMFQSRHPTTKSSLPFIVNSDSSSKLEGTVYLANGRLELNSQSTANSGAAYTAIVVNQMVFNSEGNFVVSSNYVGDTPLPALLSGLTISGTEFARLTK